MSSKYSYFFEHSRWIRSNFFGLFSFRSHVVCLGYRTCSHKIHLFAFKCFFFFLLWFVKDNLNMYICKSQTLIVLVFRSRVMHTIMVAAWLSRTARTSSMKCIFFKIHTCVYLSLARCMCVAWVGVFYSLVIRVKCATIHIYFRFT